jgi:predicted amidohydrolase
MRIGVVQIVNAEADMIASLRAGLARLQDAKEAGVDLVVFPELFLGGYYLDQAMVKRAAAARSSLARLQAAVDQLGVSCVVGVPDLRDGVLFDAVAILRPGCEPGRYAKTHLFRTEKELFTPGSSLWTGEIAGWQCGVLVCYEIAFPEVARALTLSGARLLIVPAAFGKARLRIWQIATISRAIENGCYLAAAGHAGTNGVSEFAGHSRVVDPAGEVVADAGDRAEMLIADLRPRLVDEVRAGRADSHAGLADRRPELYGALTEPRDEPHREPRR